MIRKKIAGLIVALAAVPSAAAEPSLQERAPLSHSVATMPPRFAFEIASSMAPDQGAEGVYVKLATVTLSASMRREELTWTDGNRGQIWLSDGAQLLQLPGRSEIIVKPAPPGARVSGFAGFEWIGPGNYQGLVEEAGRLCHAYGETVPDPHWLAQDGPAPLIQRRALIEAKSRFPVLLQVNGLTHWYKILPPPLQPLKLEGPFADAWRRYAPKL